ncbi:MAG: protein-L-isoaspartate(D-aspartate) O-methyltransferase [Pirellulaceae bacterium]
MVTGSKNRSGSISSATGWLAVLILLGLWPWQTCWAQGALKKKYEEQRRLMVEVAVEGAGITNQRVLAAMRDTPREAFIPNRLREQAYLDAALPIGHEQTISSPFIVAFMTESLDPQPDDRVLEIGTGSGYQAAVLSPLVRDVYTIEIVPELAENAERTLKRLKYDNVHVRAGDGFQGWPARAPFNKIIVTCSPEDVPQPLVDQLAEGGLMVIPVGERHQQSMMLMKKENGVLVETDLRPTLFVPMTGEAESVRDIMPDPDNPKLLNGSFEEDLPENGFVNGWYYQRSMELTEDSGSPEGDRHVTFLATQAGQKAHLMQGFAINGEVIGSIILSASVKCEDVLIGPHAEDLPVVAIQFLDDHRRDLGTAFIGPFRGTRSWNNFDKEIRVPEETREALIRIGLFGATGSASFDNILIRPQPRPRRRR